MAEQKSGGKPEKLKSTKLGLKKSREQALTNGPARMAWGRGQGRRLKKCHKRKKLKAPQAGRGTTREKGKVAKASKRVARSHSAGESACRVERKKECRANNTQSFKKREKDIVRATGGRNKIKGEIQNIENRWEATWGEGTPGLTKSAGERAGGEKRREKNREKHWGVN